MDRLSGILLPVFSLPSKYGIGAFSKEAYEFVDILSENGMAYWEILPINACNRLPYSPLSYYALEEDYISLDKLKEKGVSDEEIERIISMCDEMYKEHKFPYPTIDEVCNQ